MRGAQLHRRGDSNGAWESFSRAHALAPQQPEPALALGREEWKRGRLVEAEKLVRLALRCRPGWPLGTAALVRILVARGAIDKARRMLRAARRQNPKNSALLVIEGELHLDCEEPTKALESFRQAQALGAKQTAVVVGLSRAENGHGIALCGQGKFSEAAFAFKRASDLDPRWPAPHVNLGTVMQRLNSVLRARSSYERALALDPEHPTAHFNMGLLAASRGELSRAEQSFSAAKDSGHPRALHHLAVILGERGRFAQAVKLFEEILSNANELADASVLSNYGVALHGAGRRQEAETAFRLALEIDETHGPSLRHLIKLLAGDGRLIEAARLNKRFDRLPKMISNSAS